MKIYNNNVKPPELVLEFTKDHQHKFHSKFFEDIIGVSGIHIPPHMEKEFGGRKIIGIPGPKATTAEFELFEKAVRKEYFPAVLDQHNYILVEDEENEKTIKSDSAEAVQKINSKENSKEKLPTPFSSAETST